MRLARKILFLLLFLACFTGWISPPVALLTGIVFGLALAHPFINESRGGARVLLQASVVALGFGMNLHDVLRAGHNGFLYTAAGISFAICAGLLLGGWLHVRGNSSYLITVGTAICGGSAIAAVGPILQADPEEMAVSLGTVFVLNSVALLVFPPLGYALHLSQPQFGLWAALAIHDTSSVVGATARYGAEALLVGTTVKLARALWIVPVALATAAVRHNKARLQLPWFILLFCLAAVINTYAPSGSRITLSLVVLGRLGLVATLFLIGTGITRATLTAIGWRPLLQGVLLWLVVGATSLYLVHSGLIVF
jgi:uncharacterized integral membrane protein (TIGR00698 family)